MIAFANSQHLFELINLDRGVHMCHTEVRGNGGVVFAEVQNYQIVFENIRSSATINDGGEVIPDRDLQIKT